MDVVPEKKPRKRRWGGGSALPPPPVRLSQTKGLAWCCVPGTRRGARCEFDPHGGLCSCLPLSNVGTIFKETGRTESGANTCAAMRVRGSDVLSVLKICSELLFLLRAGLSNLLLSFMDSGYGLTIWRCCGCNLTPPTVILAVAPRTAAHSMNQLAGTTNGPGFARSTALVA
ncbi:hypothetical protein B0H19DRAFT_1059518 [Mycena capillaripes]|nr:hypothetical protein B0H19DRAFT_1059518 [Mycena capillaripes]